MTTTPTTFIDRARALCGLTLLLAVAVGCGGAVTNEQSIHRPGPDLRGYYATRTPGQLAYGGTTKVAPGYDRALPDLDAYLKPQPQSVSPRAVARAQFASKTVKHSPEPAPVAQPQAKQPEPMLAAATVPTTAPSADRTRDDAQRYASREAQSQKQQQYRGGDVVVISATTIIVILLIVLLVLLLT